jgi:type IV pilus assembly protein PilX
MSTRFSCNRFSTANSQTGVVLLSCLIFLTALTLLGLSASADNILQNKLSANLQETQRSRQSALSALSWAERWLLELEGGAPNICTQPCEGTFLHNRGDLSPNPEFENVSWWQEQGHEAGIDPLTGERLQSISTGSINPPMWIIEFLHESPSTEGDSGDGLTWYRILARGSGHTNSSVSVIESTVVRSWPPIDSAESPDTENQEPCLLVEPVGKCGRVSWRKLR